MLYIGIDTSCYTSSIAVVNSNEEVIFDGRIILKVTDGHRGLRQSEAVFQHIKNLGCLTEKCFERCRELTDEIGCVSVSNKPRNIADSYMPVFTVGHNTAKVIGAGLNLPVYTVSHQQNHILAGMWSSGETFKESFLVYHISGGTTELLYVKDPIDIQPELIGGTDDLNAGQFIDRVGTELGYSFPCGQQMDNLCSGTNQNTDIYVPFSVRGGHISFSGPETYIQRLIKNKEYSNSIICYNTFLCIAKAMEKSIINASANTDCKNVLLVGGVASNSIIKYYLLGSEKLMKNSINIKYSKKEYSSDNAVGSALYGRRMCLEK